MSGPQPQSSIEIMNECIIVIIIIIMHDSFISTFDEASWSFLAA
jgi:hypothetical protein